MIQILALALIGFAFLAFIIANIFVVIAPARVAPIVHAMTRSRSVMAFRIKDEIVHVVLFPGTLVLRGVLLLRGYRPEDWKT